MSIKTLVKRHHGTVRFSEGISTVQVILDGETIDRDRSFIYLDTLHSGVSAQFGAYDNMIIFERDDSTFPLNVPFKLFEVERPENEESIYFETDELRLIECLANEGLYFDEVGSHSPIWGGLSKISNELKRRQSYTNSITTM